MSIRFDIITIFPHIFDSYFNESIIKRAREKKLIDIHTHDLRKFTKDKHHKIDDRPYGGGPGMVFKIEPMVKAFKSILKTNGSLSKDKKNKYNILNKYNKRSDKTLIIFFSPAGKQFTQKIAEEYSKKYNHIIMLADRYEGFDERIKKIIKNWKFKIENLSVGPYVLTGGELPTMIVTDAICRHIPGVLGKEESLEEKRYGAGLSVYTRPEIFISQKRKYKVPKVLLSGDHKKINAWRGKHKNEKE